MTTKTFLEDCYQGKSCAYLWCVECWCSPHEPRIPATFPATSGRFAIVVAAMVALAAPMADAVALLPLISRFFSSTLPRRGAVWRAVHKLLPNDLVPSSIFYSTAAVHL